MRSRIVFYGLVAGLVVGAHIFGTMIAYDGRPPVSGFGMAVGFLTMLIAFSTIFVAVKRHRDVELGGVGRFWPGLGIGLAITVIASLVYVLAFEASLAVTGSDFGAYFTQEAIAQQRAAGISGQALADYQAEMEAFAASYADPLFRMAITFTEIFPVGLLVSLVAAALLRNRRFLPARRPAGEEDAAART